MLFRSLDWLIGPIDKVQAMTSTTRNIEVEDTGVLNIKWLNGAIGSMSVTMLTFPKNLEASITILGEKGTVRIGGVAVNNIQHWEFDEPRDYDSSIKEVNYETSSVCPPPRAAAGCPPRWSRRSWSRLRGAARFWAAAVAFLRR